MDENYWYNKYKSLNQIVLVLAGATSISIVVAMMGWSQPPKIVYTDKTVEKVVYRDKPQSKYTNVEIDFASRAWDSIAIEQDVYSENGLVARRNFGKLDRELQELGYEKWCKDHGK